MKINRIKIDHFGGLKDFSLDFSDGFNLVFGQNEDGKTTVLSFLRMMFYGDTTKSSSLNVNIRRRFTPFSGEKMGGEIEFTYGGKTYLLSKQFGKTPRSDKTVLLDLSRGTPESIEGEVGEALFGMSCAAFERSIFISGFTPAEDGSAALSAKLASTMYSGDEGESFDEIKERLEAAENAIHTSRKKGSADQLSERLALLQNELQRASENERIRAEKLSLLAEKEAYLNTLSAQKKQAEALLRAAGEKEKLSALKTELSRRETLALAEKENGELDEIKLLKAEELLKAASDKRAKAKAEQEVCRADDSPAEDFDTRLDALLIKLSSAKERVHEAEKLLAAAEKASLPAGNSTYFYLSAALFAASAAAGAFANLFFLAMLIPAAVFALLGFSASRGKNRKQNEKESLLLDLKREKAAAEDEERKINNEYLILSERRKLSLESREKASAERERRLKSAADELLLADKAEAEALNLLGATGGDASVAISECRKRLEKISALREVIKTGSYRDMTDQELRERISAPQNDSLESAESYSLKLKAIEQQINETHGTIARLRTENESLLRSCRTVGVIENDIFDIKRALSEQESHFKALQLAKRVLSEAYDDMRLNFAPELNRLTGELLAGLTGGKHSRAAISNDLMITVSEEGVTPYSAEYLSSGSADQAELCLRLAISRLTAGERKLPLLLDDVLMQYDDGRAEKATEFFAEYAKDNQVLLFTCHGFFKALAEKQNATIVNMK